MIDDKHSRRTFLATSLAAATSLGFAPLPALARDGNASLAELSLREASERVRAQSVSSVDLTRACLARIDAYNSVLNAFITVTRDEALKTAGQMDRERRRGILRGPLHGIPIALKDNIDTAGVRTTGASEVFEDRVPDADAEVAGRLKQAGAVLLGKLNLRELAYGGSSTVSYFGTMHNPWNPAYETGGSSGGPGAAVAAALCFAALGTDTAGSVRIPASHCGIVGLKPTYGRVSTRGVIPLSWTLDHVGPLCRSVEDTAIVLNAIAGHDDREPTSADEPVPDYVATLRRATTGLRLGTPRSPYYRDVEADVDRAVSAALDVMRGLSASVVDVELPAWGSPATIWGAEAYAYHEPWMTKTPERYQPSTRKRLEEGSKILAWKYAAARREVDLLRQSIERAFDEVDLLVLPTVKRPPARLGTKQPSLGNNNVAFDVFGLPAISVPCGFTPSGLPMGVQIVGRHFAEPTVLAFADAYQRATGWHKRHPPLAAAAPASGADRSGRAVHG